MICKLSDYFLSDYFSATGDKFVITPPAIDANTKLLLHFNGSNGSNTFIDSSLSQKTVTANGNAQISNAQSVFGGASGLFGGSTYIYVANHSDFDFGSGDFTIEGFFRPSSVTGVQILIAYRHLSTGVTPFLIYLVGNKVNFRFGNTSNAELTLTATTSLSINAWYHIAGLKNGNLIKLFINGTQEGGNGSVSGSAYVSNGTLRIGGDTSSSFYSGYIDELRISNVARWTANFTPLTQEY